MIRFVFNSDLDFKPGAKTPISLQKPKWMLSYFQEMGDMELLSASSAQANHLYRVHDVEYVDSVFSGRVPDGFGLTNRLYLPQILAANGVMMTAVSAAMNSPRNPVFAPVSGFHHARFDEASGFCTFNGLILPIVFHRVRTTGVALKKVLIIDGDAHYGDGTDDIIDCLGLDGITNLSHQSRRTKLSPSTWEAQLRGLLTNHRWDLVIYQAGADAHKDDPYEAGYLDDEAWDRRDKLVFDHQRLIGFPLVWNLAGGYNGEKTRELHLRTLTTALKGQALRRSTPAP